MSERLDLKIGDVVIWEEWAGPQILVRTHFIYNGNVEMAELRPARPDVDSKEIGHDVPFDDIEWWGFQSELTECDEDGELKY